MPKIETCKQFYPLAIAFGILLSADSCGQHKPIVIQEQGSFAVGGSIVTNAGTFDPIKRTPEGQTFHGDHAYVFFLWQRQLI
jgi:hypothetical protein